MNTEHGQVWWRNPGEQTLHRLRLDAEGGVAFRYAPFQVTPTHQVLELIGEAEACDFPEPGTVRHLRQGEGSGATRTEHEAGVSGALEAIDSGVFQKVVLSRSEFWESTSAPELLFRSKCEAYPNAFVYLFSHPQSGVWLGATPELLLRARGGRFETVSLAGTRSVGSGEWTEKELREQQLVTDFIQGALRTCHAESMQIGDVHEHAYGQLRHLETHISFTSTHSTDEWLEVLHPTPAVGGQPREAALNFIRTHEVLPRGYYAGYLGLIGTGTADFYVNLRCMACFTNGYRVFAGGGIVEGSQPRAEWEETRAKIESIRMELAS